MPNRSNCCVALTTEVDGRAGKWMNESINGHLTDRKKSASNESSSKTISFHKCQLKKEDGEEDKGTERATQRTF